MLHDIDELVTINNATTGTITTNSSVNLSGTGSKVSQAVAEFGQDGYQGNVSLITSATIDEINTITDLINGSLTLHSSIGLTGTASTLAETIVDIDSYQGDVTIEGDHTVLQLKTINLNTEGDITFGNNDLALTSDDDTLAAALNGVTDYAGTVTINSAHSLENLTIINDAVSGTVVVSDSDSEQMEVHNHRCCTCDFRGYTGDVIFSAATAGENDSIKEYTEGSLDGTLISALTGTASALLLSVDKLDTKPSDDSNITATITGDTDATDITDLANLSYVDTVVATAVGRIDGTAEEVVAALTALGDNAPDTFSSDLTGAASAAHIATINTNNGDGAIDSLLLVQLQRLSLQ